MNFSLFVCCISGKILPIKFSSCGVKDPSWTEVKHFVTFLDIQLQTCERSCFCDETFVGDVMRGFKSFVVKFMIRMSRVSFVHIYHMGIN